jgi:DNA-binding transcriptional MerR regulator
VLNPPEPQAIDLLGLSDRARVSTRTIRYYIQQGLLPAPATKGPGAHYMEEHVDRLLLIKRLQREHLPLSEIRKRLESLTPREVRRVLESKPEQSNDSAAEYVQRVLMEGPASYAMATQRSVSVPHANLPRDQSRHSPITTRSQWERFNLSSDVELHVRRPVSREENRKIERLLDAARRIFNEELP